MLDASRLPTSYVLRFTLVALSKAISGTDTKLLRGKTVSRLKFLHDQLRLTPKPHRTTEYTLSPAP